MTMPLSRSERIALEDAVRIANVVMREHSATNTAFALACFATVVVGTDRRARTALAHAMIRHAAELLDADAVISRLH
jgi:hypothetical protein